MKRHWTGLAAPTFVVLCLFLVSFFPASADTPSVPAAPASLAMTVSGATQTLGAGSWINTTKLDLRMQVQITSGPLTPQVEIAPSDIPFAGKPTATGTPLSASGTAVVTASGLLNRKTYHWEARVVDTTGNASNWVLYAAVDQTSDDIGVDQDPPFRPVIRSSTDPDQNHWYNTAVELLQWQAHDPLSGVAGYSLVLEKRAHVIPPGTVTAQQAAKISNLSDGTWFVAVRAVDHAGNWSPTATFRLQIDRRPAHLTWLSPGRFVFNPFDGPTTVRFRVDKAASALLTLYRVGSTSPIASYSFPRLLAGQTAVVTWNGKNGRGRAVPRGYYFFSAQLVDHANNLTRVNVGGIDVKPLQATVSPAGVLVYPDAGKRIIVSLSKEALYAYDGNKLLLQTLVTTGNPALPTPAGHYSIMDKYHPFQFISPWPEGSPYYYAPSWVTYAMLFRDGGYFLHDAPWRSVFGPGSNGPGTPGTNYGGTHGCVNIPPAAMQFLWDWAPVGTVVDVVP